MLEKKARTAIDKYSMIPGKATVLVAVSGGPDSIALLHFLNKAGYKTFAAHLDHRLRGKAAADDLRFVRSFCRRLGVSLISASSDIGSLAKRLKVSTEEAGRIGRYAFFNRAAKKCGASKVALAHHADDNIETFLMRIMRGTGLKGLCGIPPVRDDIIRPLIDASKSEILDYCARNDLSYRLDHTNFEDKFTRNRIRNILIPSLEREIPGFKKKVLLLIKGFCRDQVLLSRYVSAVMKKTVKKTGRAVCVNRGGLMSLPPDMRGYVVRSAIELYKGDLKDISSAHVEAVLSLDAGHICLPGGIYIQACGGKYLISRDIEKKPKPVRFRYSLKVPGKVRVKEANASIRAVLCRRPKDLRKAPASTAYLDASKIKGLALQVRSFRPGDRFVPFGMKGSKKLQDFFVDSKIPPGQRCLVPVVCDAEKIVWLAGLRPDERARVEPSTKSFVRLEILR
jgi:tRNA(Ile)-lysidine synthase